MKNWKIFKLESCESTNNLAKQMKLKGEIDNKTAILSDFQTSGRGQGQNAWHSEPTKNMLCSLYFKTDIAVEKHFFLIIIVSLALHELLKDSRIDSRIKWPNDIYAGNRKIAGILIENSLMRNTIVDTIIGVGLNVNQDIFPEWIPNPVSMNQLTQETSVVSSLLEKLTLYIDNNHNDLLNGSFEELFHRYNKLLYKLNTWSIFESNGHSFNGQIRGVMPDGKLLVETDGGQMKHFLFGEVKYVI